MISETILFRRVIFAASEIIFLILTQLHPIEGKSKNFIVYQLEILRKGNFFHLQIKTKISKLCITKFTWTTNKTIIEGIFFQKTQKMGFGRKVFIVLYKNTLYT